MKKCNVVHKGPYIKQYMGVTWVDETFQTDGADFLVFCGPRIELNYHPDSLVRFNAMEQIGVVVADVSIHDIDTAFPAPLGYPAFRDDFYIVKVGPYSEAFLAEIRKGRSVSAVVWELGVKPVEYPSTTITVHCDPASTPEIHWGLS